MFRDILPVSIMLSCTLVAQGQVAFTGTYTQDFDALGPTGTDYPEGWSAVRYAGTGTAGAALTLGVSNGSSTGAGVYNVGTIGDSDRAIGSLASGSTMPRFGMQLRNQSGMPVQRLSLDAVVEQWRTGSSASAVERLPFEYSLDAAHINDAAATWTALPDMDLLEILTGSTSAGALNGNLPENQLSRHSELDQLNWLEGQTLTIRWSDGDVTGSDGLFAVDNLRLGASVQSVPEPSTVALSVLGGLALLLGIRRRPCLV